MKIPYAMFSVTQCIHSFEFKFIINALKFYRHVSQLTVQFSILSIKVLYIKMFADNKFRINGIQLFMYGILWKYGVRKIEILWNKITDLPVFRTIKSYIGYWIT